MIAAEPIDDKYTKVFFPHAEKRIATMKANGGRFVYYTTAEVAASILRERTVWMRNAMAMNDFTEIAHGLECVRHAYAGDAGKLFTTVLNQCYPGLGEEVKARFDAWCPSFQLNTYLTCLSEHRCEEDRNGRLSMWRAYGGSSGVAIVLNGSPLFRESGPLGVHSSPVSYFEPLRFVEEFTHVANGMKAEANYIKSLDREMVGNAAFVMLRFAALCTKHPGFREELEWRVIASPSLHPTGRLTPSVETVRGVPQVVQKLELKNDPGAGVVGLEIPELVERIIIGPCEFSFVVYDALHTLLKAAGVTDPGKRIVTSDIPLRHL